MARDHAARSDQVGNEDAAGLRQEDNDAAADVGMSGRQPAPGEDAAEARDGGADDTSLAAQLEQARAELAEQKDRYLRTAAEAENIRRRAENDVANARKFAVESFASEILAVRDSLEIARSLEISDGDTGAVAKMKEGLDLTLRQLDSALAKFSIAVVDPRKGDKLDPERHQAMTTQESDKVPPNHILAVMQKGYTIHDRLLRPAMVVVARKPEGAAQTEGDNGLNT
ncbi:MAG: nucleotide exchange factor GrpE [Arenicellales bacterium]